MRSPLAPILLGLLATLLTACADLPSTDELAGIHNGQLTLVALRLTAATNGRMFQPLPYYAQTQGRLSYLHGSLEGNSDDIPLPTVRSPSPQWHDRGWFFFVVPRGTHYFCVRLGTAIVPALEYRIDIPPNAPTVYAGSLFLVPDGYSGAFGQVVITEFTPADALLRDESADAAAMLRAIPDLPPPQTLLMRPYPADDAPLPAAGSLRLGALGPFVRPDFTSLNTIKDDPFARIQTGGNDPFIFFFSLALTSASLSVHGVEFAYHSSLNSRYEPIWKALESQIAAPALHTALEKAAHLSPQLPESTAGPAWELRIVRIQLWPISDDQCRLELAVRATLRDGIQTLYDGVLVWPGSKFQPLRPHEHALRLPPVTLSVKELQTNPACVPAELARGITAIINTLTKPPAPAHSTRLYPN